MVSSRLRSLFAIGIAVTAGFAVVALNDRSSRVSQAGTVLIMLFVALVVVARLRSLERMHRRLTEELHLQSTHDALTGLANRRQLSIDLAAAARVATAARPARLAVFDLDGFKAYNDSFGHHGGDLLLRRLARALADVVEPAGSCYRLGGDEFCALLRDDVDERILHLCVEALSESGEAFTIASSFGSVLLPIETADADAALHLADERLDKDRGSGSVSVGQQTRDLALKMLSVQEPDLRHHSAHVAALAAGIGERLGMTHGDCADLVRAAELHDVGKVAVPDGILHKAAPLSADEWEIMLRHPTIGANILSAAPALKQVAEYVRCSHERYDGRGYPRKLAGEDIPLASRIVFVCDAFDAMVSDRPYRAAMSDEAALDQLSRNAGTQFDPAVVTAFRDEYRDRSLQELRPERASLGLHGV
ncbi:MAG: hypothetical protein QOF27_900 [Gaiellaceae bacterium]|nr:hypothetical protein [Gaiellaceae bacterium]